MRKSGLIMAFIVFMSAFLFTLTILPENVEATTLYVGGSGPGNYTTIQGAIDNASSGDTIYVYNGTYNEHIRVDKILSLIGEYRDNTTIDAGGTGDVVNITANWVNMTGFTIVMGYGFDDAGILLYEVENCSIMNTNVSDNWNGIYLIGSNYNLIANNIAFDNGRGVKLDNSDNNLVIGNTALNNWDYGIFLVSSKNVKIRANNISQSDVGIYLIDSSTIDIMDNNATYNGYGVRLEWSSNITVEHNSMWGNWSPGISAEASPDVLIMENNVSNNYIGIRLYSCHNATITKNNISSSYWYGVHLYASTHSSLTSNSMVGDGIFISGDSLSYWNTHTIDTSNTVNGRPVRYWKNVTGGMVPPNAGEVILVNCTDVVVAQQDISNSSVGIVLGFSSSNIIADNNLSSNTVEGVYLYRSDNNTLANNTALPENDCGIYLRSSNNNTVSNNTASSNKDYGIFLYRSRGNMVSHNSVHSNAVIGIRLYYSDNNTLYGNDLSGNGHAIALYLSSNNTIAGNVVYRNINFGIRLGSSQGNNVYHNNFINNTEQASDDTNANRWDDGYPSGGNYWSNYTGEDNCSGPNQDICPDPDGIGDTPYVIDADSLDRYPLMFPFGIFPPRPPRMLQANLSGRNFENVTLSWSLSQDDGAGRNNVDRYDIYRGSTYDSNGSSYLFYASVPAGNSSFVDAGAGEGNSSNYFYRVCAVSGANLFSCSANQAGKFTRPLTRGPNIVSVPFIQSNESIESVLRTVEWDKAWTYDSFSGKWNWYMAFKPYRGDLKTINHTMGLWLNVTSDCNLTVAGVVPARTEIRLPAGWNLLGFPSFNSTYTIAYLKAITNATRIEGFDSISSPHYLQVLGDAVILEAGYGYWIRVQTEKTWVVESS